MQRVVACVLAAGCVAAGWATDARAQGEEARFRVVIRSTLSNAFALQEAQWSLDGAQNQVRAFTQDAAVNSGGDVILQDGALAAGSHTVNVSMVYQGTGYGMFTYLKGYQFTLKGTQTFQTEPGKEVTIRALAYEKGDLTTEIKDKPALKLENAFRDLAAERAAQPPAPPGAAAPTGVQQTQLKTAEEAESARLDAISQRVTELGQRLEKVRERLGVLQDAAVSGTTSAGKAQLTFRNEMGSSFKLRELHVYLDGNAVRDETDTTGDALAQKEEINLFDGRILPGNHTINVSLVYLGVGYGVFNYLNDMQFKIRSSSTFAVEQGKQTNVKLVAYESGDARTEIKDRPTVRFDTQVADAPAVVAPADPAAPAPR